MCYRAELGTCGGYIMLAVQTADTKVLQVYYCWLCLHFVFV